MSGADDKYISAALQLMLTIIEVLDGNEIDGLAPSQIGKLAGCSAPQVTKYIANLRAKGWAEEIQSTGRWRLGPKPVRLFAIHTLAMDRAQRQLDEAKARFGGALS